MPPQTLAFWNAAHQIGRRFADNTGFENCMCMHFTHFVTHLTHCVMHLSHFGILDVLDPFISYTLQLTNWSNQTFMDPLNFARQGMPKSFAELLIVKTMGNIPNFGPL